MDKVIELEDICYKAIERISYDSDGRFLGIKYLLEKTDNKNSHYTNSQQLSDFFSNPDDEWILLS